MRLFTSAALAVVLGLGVAATTPTMGLAQDDVEMGISVGYAPPPLPIYDQPPIPGYGYIWTPGYWAWDPEYGDYYWVPGTWILPPDVGLLWTPAWWGWSDGFYVFHRGYWGPHIGFYGGINYGFGYTGYGYQGGYWRGREFFYNRAVNNVRNVRITNVFEHPVIQPPRQNRVSYSGGVGGIVARPTVEQLEAMRERHISATRDQVRQTQMAATNRSMMARVNHGAPPVASTRTPGGFNPGYRPSGSQTQSDHMALLPVPRGSGYNSTDSSHGYVPVGPRPSYSSPPPPPPPPAYRAPTYRPPVGSPGGFAQPAPPHVSAPHPPPQQHAPPPAPRAPSPPPHGGSPQR